MVRRLEDDPAQREVLALIVESLVSGESTLTTQELGKRCRPSRGKSNIYNVLRKLEENDYIVRDVGENGNAIPGSIRLRGMPKTRPAPLVGRIAAGSPIPIVGDDVQEYVSLPIDRVRDKEVFLLRVVGDSMTGDGILNGDLIVATSDPDPGENNIVVVVRGEGEDAEATVKRVRREPDGILLLSSNPDFEPKFVHRSDKPFIQGRVIGVIRWLS